MQRILTYHPRRQAGSRLGVLIPVALLLCVGWYLFLRPATYEGKRYAHWMNQVLASDTPGEYDAACQHASAALRAMGRAGFREIHRDLTCRRQGGTFQKAIHFLLGNLGMVTRQDAISHREHRGILACRLLEDLPPQLALDLAGFQNTSLAQPPYFNLLAAEVYYQHASRRITTLDELLDYIQKPVLPEGCTVPLQHIESLQRFHALESLTNHAVRSLETFGVLSNLVFNCHANSLVTFMTLSQLEAFYPDKMAGLGRQIYSLRDLHGGASGFEVPYTTLRSYFPHFDPRTGGYVPITDPHLFPILAPDAQLFLPSVHGGDRVSYHEGQLLRQGYMYDAESYHGAKGVGRCQVDWNKAGRYDFRAIQLRHHIRQLLRSGEFTHLTVSMASGARNPLLAAINTRYGIDVLPFTVQYRKGDISFAVRISSLHLFEE